MHMHANQEFKTGRINADALVGLPNPMPKNYSAAETTAIRQLWFKRRREYYSVYVSGFILNEVDTIEVASQWDNIPDTWFESGWIV